MDFDEYLRQDAQLREHWKRSLPLGDTLDDRWGRAERLGFAEGASIYNSTVVLGDVKVGEGTWVGPFVVLDGYHSPLSIGAWNTVCAGVQIYTHDSVRWALSGGQAEYDHSPTSIGDRCYLGPNVVVARGVTVGDMAVVGANAFVNRNVEERTVVAGAPAKPIARVEGDGDDVKVVPL